MYGVVYPKPSARTSEHLRSDLTAKNTSSLEDSGAGIRDVVGGSENDAYDVDAGDTSVMMMVGSAENG